MKFLLELGEHHRRLEDRDREEAVGVPDSPHLLHWIYGGVNYMEVMRPLDILVHLMAIFVHLFLRSFFAVADIDGSLMTSLRLVWPFPIRPIVLGLRANFAPKLVDEFVLSGPHKMMLAMHLRMLSDRGEDGNRGRHQAGRTPQLRRLLVNNRDHGRVRRFEPIRRPHRSFGGGSLEPHEFLVHTQNHLLRRQILTTFAYWIALQMTGTDSLRGIEIGGLDAPQTAPGGVVLAG